jgi:hypothetical protein
VRTRCNVAPPASGLDRVAPSVRAGVSPRPYLVNTATSVCVGPLGRLQLVGPLSIDIQRVLVDTVQSPLRLLRDLRLERAASIPNARSVISRISDSKRGTSKVKFAW